MDYPKADGARRTMRSLKLLSLAVTATAFMALSVAVTSASATTIEIGGVAQNQSVVFEASLSAGTSLTQRDLGGTLFGTCTGSAFKGKTESPFTASTVTGALSSLSFTSCAGQLPVVINPGKFHFAWTSKTNGTLSWSGTEITINAAYLGGSCIFKTGSGTTVGTITGVTSGSAIIHLNA